MMKKIITLGVLAVLALAIYIAVGSISANEEEQAVVLPEAGAKKTEAVTVEKPLPKVLEREVSSSPSRLIIPKAGVNARVLSMGLRKDGKMDVPANFVDAGWFSLGARPGEVGSAVIGAHVDNGGSIPGIFKNLKALQVGDEVTVVRDDGKVLRFAVKEAKVYDANEKATDDIFFRADKPRLNLITCHGEWLPNLNTYSQRLIVFAELAE